MALICIPGCYGKQGMVTGEIFTSLMAIGLIQNPWKTVNVVIYSRRTICLMSRVMEIIGKEFQETG